MKKLTGLVQFLTLILILSATQLQAEVKNKSILGEWHYEVIDAPMGYEKGSLIFSEKEGKTVCIVRLEAGELAVDDLKIEENKITFTTVVEGSPVRVELTHEKGKLTGKVDSQEGPKTITASKK